LRIRGEAVWAGLGVTEWSVIPCDVSVTDVFVKDPVLLVAETRSRLIARSTGSHLAMWDDQLAAHGDLLAPTMTMRRHCSHASIILVAQPDRRGGNRIQ
jgi:hypothetical protein